MLRSRIFTLGIILVVPVCLIAITAPLLTQFDPLEINTANKLQPMSWWDPSFRYG